MRTGPGPTSRRLVYSAFFLSGVTALIYEVLWLRQLILIFGSTLLATSTVLSCFMGGLALGAYVGGRLITGSRTRPLCAYALLEILIGLYALIMPSLLESMMPLYRVIWNAGAADSFWLFTLARSFGVTLILMLPTVMMGATLPVLVRETARDPTRAGSDVGTLYAINTLGGVAGTFVAGFLALPWFGMRLTSLSTAMVNVGLGIGVLAYDRLRSSGGPEAIAVSSPEPEPAARLPPALLALAVSGFVALVLEVVWTRVLVLVLGSSVYSFSLMLIAFLAGLGCGSAIVSRVLSRLPPARVAPAVAGLFVLAGTLAYATAFLFVKLPEFFARLHYSWSPGPASWLAIQFVLALLIMFPATCALGGVLPGIVQLHADRIHRLPRLLGAAYAWNTVGAVAGAIVAGYVLVPRLGVRDSIVCVAAMEICVGLAVYWSGSAAPLRARTVVAACIAMLASAILLVRPAWELLLMNSGVYTDIQYKSSWDEFLDANVTRESVLYAAEGLTASVIVSEKPGVDNRYMKINGKVEASSRGDLDTQLMCGLLPVLLHADPKDALLIGLGSGMTAGAIGSYPVTAIRIVEIESAVIEAARLFSRENRNVLDDPRVTLSINDARNELALSRRSYDVIVSQPSNPWMTVASNLFTRDFFEIARSRLRANGIFSQWLHTYNLTTGDVRSIIASFRSVFRGAMLFATYDGIDLILLGSMTPLHFEIEGINRRIRSLAVRPELTRTEIRTAADLMPFFVMGERQIDALVAGAHHNTDDNARVEFSAPLSLRTETRRANQLLLESRSGDAMSYVDPAPGTAVERDRLVLALANAWLRRGEPLRGATIARTLLGGPLSPEAAAFIRDHGPQDYAAPE